MNGLALTEKSGEARHGAVANIVLIALKSFINSAVHSRDFFDLIAFNPAVRFAKSVCEPQKCRQLLARLRSGPI